MISKPQMLTLMLLATASLSCALLERRKPIPEEKRAFIGVWTARSGFTIDVRPEGFADVLQGTGTAASDSQNLNIRVAPAIISHIRVYFRGDTALELISPLNYGRTYRIDRAPYFEHGHRRMVLNGVTLEER